MNAIPFNRDFSRNRREFLPMTDEAIRTYAPSVFAESAHQSRSDRYVYIPTKDVLAGMRQNGFLPVAAKQSRSRIEGKAEFTKHMIRFRREDSGAVALHETFPEVVLVNSHDGTSSYQLMAGLFRLVCLNGMVVSAGDIEAVRVPHSGNIVDKVIEGSFRVLESARLALAAPDKWSKIELNTTERLALADAARVLRFGDAEGNVTTPIEASQLLSVRRHGDERPSLWNTFNVIQENTMKGGLTGRAPRQPNERRGRRVTTRPVNGIDQDVKLNKALWVLADRMAQMKAA